MLHDKHLKYSLEPGDEGGGTEQDDDPQALASSAKLIEKSITDGLDFEFYVGPWSTCSQTCGISGYRVSNDEHNTRFPVIIINHSIVLLLFLFR